MITVTQATSSKTETEYETSNVNDYSFSEYEESSYVDEHTPNKSTISFDSLAFNQNIAINQIYEDKASYVILCSDGTLKAKGSNEYGQLGNGGRLSSDDWQSIPNLHDIKQISSGTIGSRFYAIDNSGSLYYWGFGVLEPKKISFDNKIERIMVFNGYSKPFIQTDTGEIYYIDDLESQPNSNVSLTKAEYIPAGVDDIVFYTDGLYIGYIMNGKFYKVDIRTEEIIEEYNRSDLLYYCGDDTFITVNHSVVKIDKDSEQELLPENMCKKYFHDTYNGTEYALAYSEDSSISKLRAVGNNKHGQLGDGTTKEYYVNWLEVPNIQVSDFEASSRGFVYAIGMEMDEDFEMIQGVYAWGKGYTTTPTIIISLSDFNN